MLLGNLGNPAGEVASGAVLGAVSDTILLLLGPMCPVVQPLSLDEKSLTQLFAVRELSSSAALSPQLIQRQPGG